MNGTNVQGESMKSQSFLKGAAILTFSAIVVKIIGFVYTIPLINVLGGEGMGYYYAAYDIYAFLSIVFTAGVPVAEIKLISEAYAKGNYRLVDGVFSISRFLFACFGTICASAMFFGADFFADIIKSPNASPAIRALAPMILSAAILSAYRGYFQGKSNMLPTAITQILEAVIKMAVGISLVLVLLNHGIGITYVAAGAIFGVSTGSILALICAIIFKRLEKKQTGMKCALHINREERKRIISQILALAIPITIGTVSFNLINLIDTGIILNRLQSALGYSYEEANTLFGIYGNAKKIYNLPVGLIIPLSSSIIPAITRAKSKNQFQKASNLTFQAIKITAMFSLPCGTGAHC